MGAQVAAHQTAQRQPADPGRLAADRSPQRSPSVRCGIGRLQSVAGNRHMHRLLAGRTIQTKLTVGPADDEYEREADHVADEVMRTPDPASPPAIRSVPHRVGRQCAECEREEQEETTVQAKHAPDAGLPSPSSALHTAGLPVEVVPPGGRPLEPAVRRSMESRFRCDFGRVMVHTDARAAGSAQRLNARAYTTGPNIVFGAGQYSPHTPAGAQLLAHELTHVVQQEQSPAWSSGVEALAGGGHRIRVLPPLGERHDTFEREAEARPQRSAIFQRARSASLQRVELPRPVPICGALVTDIDILPPRPRALVECGLPPSVLVTRVNVVGRQRTAGSTGRGRIIFNLHIGYYRDPATGRFCAVMSDSTRCLTPGGCIHLPCLPTLREILDAILDFLKFLGIVILLILLYILLRGRRLPTVDPLPPPVYAGGREEQEDRGA